MKKRTKKRVANALTLVGLVGLCYLVFVDHRPDDYVALDGSFSRYEVQETNGRYGRRHDRIVLDEYSKPFQLAKNGTSYNKVEQFFETVPKGEIVTVWIDADAIDDTTHNHLVYAISFRDSLVFDLRK